MPGKRRKFVTKFLLAGVTLFCVSWIASVNEWHAGVRWSRRTDRRGFTTMRTIVAYSEGKQAEMDRPSPLACDRLPRFPEIPLINRTWTAQSADQPWQHVTGTKVSLYAAYYDERTPQKYVRILASFRGRNFSAEDTLFCQTRSINPDEDFIEVVAAKPLEIWWHAWDATSTEVDTPLLLSCPLTEPLYSQSVVSIVTLPCDDPTNAFSLNPLRDKKSKRKFTICVKDMNFNKDISRNIIEWIETNRILGVDMIDMYIDKLGQETEEVLQYYRYKEYVRLYSVPIRNKGERSLWQRRRDHIVTYNDCLYRNLKDSEFIIPLDVDEIILPKKAKNLSELLHRLSSHGWGPSHSAIMIRNVFFFDFMQDVNKHNKIHLSKSKMYTKRDDVRIEDSGNIGDIELENKINNKVIDITDKLMLDKYKARCGKALSAPKIGRHFISSAMVSPIGSYTKSVMVTKRVLTAFNHYPLASLGGVGFTGWAAPFNEVQLNHYKCGKTQIANFISESINIEEAGIPKPTQGVRIVEFELSNLNVNGKSTNVDIELWDCSGDHRFESCWPALRLGIQGVILVCSPNTLQAAAREMELLYNYFVSQPKLSAKQCVIFYNCTDSDDQEDMDALTLSPTFSKVSRVAINLKSGGNRLKIDFSSYVTSILQSLNKEV